MNSSRGSLTVDAALLHAAFADLLDQAQLASAVRLLQEKYAGKPDFSVQYFVRECCSVLGVETLRSQLVQNLVVQINQQRRQSLLQHGKPPEDGALHEVATSVFQLLFRALVDSAGPLRSREIVRYVIATLDKLALARDVRASLALWLNGDMPVIEAQLPRPVMTRLINCAYVGLCEYCGPVKADALLHEAVENVSRTPAGQVFHPRQLL